MFDEVARVFGVFFALISGDDDGRKHIVISRDYNSIRRHSALGKIPRAE